MLSDDTSLAANGDKMRTPRSRPVTVPSRPRLSRNTVLMIGASLWLIAPSGPELSAPKDGTWVPGWSHRRMARL
eukprot:9781376-Lingulodinium_polyedra.AAC.1